MTLLRAPTILMSGIMYMLELPEHESWGFAIAKLVTWIVRLASSL